MARQIKKKIPPVIEVLPSTKEDTLGEDGLGAAELLAVVPVIDPVEIFEDDGEKSETTIEVPEKNAPGKSNYPARYNPLDIYLREVQRIPPLTRDEEKALAVKYVAHKDINAARSLIQANLWLVIKIARDYQNAAKNLLDLIQEGNIGLMEAVKNFDPLREVRFPSYAVWWIKAYIVRYLIANFRMVKLGTTQAQRKLFFNLKKEKEKLEREGLFPAPKLLAEKLQVKESEVIEMEQRLGSSDLSVDTPLHDNPDSDMLSILPSGIENAEEIFSKREIEEQIRDKFDIFEKTLNEKERVIFRQRLLSEEKVTLQELSDKFHVSKERIRQIEERLLSKLKVFLTDNLDPLEI